MRTLAFALLLALLPAHAAPPDAEWRTIATEHFRLHYPKPAEAWAMAAASRLEAMRARVRDQVGYELDVMVDIVVRDPYATSNGAAFPILKRPRVELWVSPPPADSPIGWNRRWDEGVIVHEDAHVVHLARPARGGVDAALDAMLGFGPVARKVPRWVAEGYATVVEGDQTGFGRPFSARLAAELRKLATEGALPTYDELDGSPRWMGGGFAYGVGSAFLRWLREREGEESLRHLWTRLAAVELRTFDEAFEGLFGDAPATLYGRFCAELTFQAMLQEQLSPPDRTTRWLDLDGSTGAPALSPDGAHLAFVSADSPRRLVIYKTEVDADKVAEDRAKSVEDLLQADPEDIPDRVKPEPPVELAWQRMRRDRSPSSPRWIDDGTVLFTGLRYDRTGRARTDLFAWSFEQSTERVVTFHADVRDADPAPDGTWAVAIQQIWGQSALVRVDLNTGELTPITPLSVDAAYDQPRISPDGTQIAWLAMHDTRWELYVGSIDGEPRQLATPSGANLATPAWHPDGDRLVVSMGTPAWLDVVEVPLDGSPIRRLTRSHGGAFAPEPGADHLYWLDEDADGRDVHRIDLPTSSEPLPELAEPSLATTPSPPTLPLPARVEVQSEPYGLGRTEGRGLLSGAFSGEALRLELVARYGDLIGRHELLIAVGGAYATDRDTDRWGDGVRAAFAIRSLPVDLHIDAFAHRALATPGLIGGAVAVADVHRFPQGFVTGKAGIGAGFGREGADRHLAFASSTLRVEDRAYRLASLDLSARAAGGLVDQGYGGWAHSHADLGLFDRALSLSVGYGAALGDADPIRLGAVREVTLPDAWQSDQILRAAFPTIAGRRHLSTAARIGSDVALFGERHTLGDAPQLQRGATVVGIETRGQFEALPLFKVPSGRFELGVGCRVEDPAEGIGRRPCLSIEDWTTWGAFTWRR